MYPVAYQSPIDTAPSNTYQWFWHLVGPLPHGSMLLDYGCGSGRFVKEALVQGYSVVGVEFGHTMVNQLENAFPKTKFYTVDQFHSRESPAFDVVFLSNVIEHLSNPTEVLSFLVKNLKPGGLLVAEGPLETNRSFANLFRRLTFRLRKSLFRTTAKHVPTHVLMANKRNQLQFFKNVGLSTTYFRLNEQPWPFPYFWKIGEAPSKLLLVVVARVSVFLQPFIPGYGNTFVYIGRKPLH